MKFSSSLRKLISVSGIAERVNRKALFNDTISSPLFTVGMFFALLLPSTGTALYISSSSFMSVLSIPARKFHWSGNGISVSGSIKQLFPLSSASLCNGSAIRCRALYLKACPGWGTTCQSLSFYQIQKSLLLQ